MLSKNKILDIDITNESSEKILEYVFDHIKKGEKFSIFTPNPEILVYANHHQSYKNILNEARVAIPDGAGLFLASLFIGKPFKERIPGISFMEELCKNSVRNAVSIGLLGGRPAVAEKTAECLRKKYPGINIVYIAQEWSEEGVVNDVSSSMYHVVSSNNDDKKNIHNTKYMLHNTKIDLLFVAFGHPKQEKWIHENLKNLPVTVAMGVGGSFDYISGEVKRAPFIIRAVGFEWLYRLVREPWRWRRQLALIEFIWLILKGILKINQA